MIVRHDDSPCGSMLKGGAESATTWLVFGETTRAMTDVSDILPDDVDTLRVQLNAVLADHAAIVAERDAAVSERDDAVSERNTIRAEHDQLEARYQRLESILAEIRRAHFGRKSEKIDDNQLALALEELETSLTKSEAEADKAEDQAEKAGKPARAKGGRRSRFPNLDHLPHVIEVIEPESKTCLCCGGELHVIGEDVSKRLDVVPAQYRVLETHRPKFACRSCESNGADNVAGVIQVPASARLIVGGLPTEALVAQVVVSKHADHLPLYRQAQILERQGVEIERSTLAHWVGAAAAELQPLHDHLLRQLKASPKLFCDETRCPVLDPGRGKTKTGFMWSIARDDRPWGGTDPPAVAYTYAPGRGAVHAVKLLAGYSGILQVDGYSAYAALTNPARDGGAVTLAFCWAHLRRRFYEVYVGGNAPIATEALARIKLLYNIEAEIRGLPPEMRKAVRQEKSKPVIEDMKLWFEATFAKVSKGGRIADAIRYGLNHWDGLVRFLDDGRIEIDSNTVERSIRSIVLDRKNSLFAGHDLGAEGWAMISSLLETAKLNRVNPQAWLTDVLTKLVNLWPASRIDELMPWAYAKKPS
jgi:transposase